MAGQLPPDLPDPDGLAPGFLHVYNPATGRWYRLVDGAWWWVDAGAVHPPPFDPPPRT